MPFQYATGQDSPLALDPHRCSGGWELDRRLRPSHVGLVCPESLKVGRSQLYRARGAV
jgi:hypothetical protein